MAYPMKVFLSRQRIKGSTIPTAYSDAYFFQPLASLSTGSKICDWWHRISLESYVNAFCKDPSADPQIQAQNRRRDCEHPY
jgi:hypothetical protein